MTFQEKKNEVHVWLCLQEYSIVVLVYIVSKWKPNWEKKTETTDN